METVDERCRRWFYQGMTAQERIDGLLEDVTTLRKENAYMKKELEEIRSTHTKKKNKE